MKKYFKVLILFLLLASTLKAQKIHFILVTDSDDRSIGMGCQMDQMIMLAGIMNPVSETLGYELNKKIINGSNFNYSNVKTAVDDLSCEPEDIIFFYYSGHGFNTKERTDKWPILHLKSSKLLALNEVHNLLKDKGASLCITFGDLCNEIIPKDKIVQLQSKSVPIDDVDESNKKKIYEQLFLNQKGDILIASCKKGQLAWTDNWKGSYYTQFFEEAFKNAAENRKKVSWRKLLKDANQRLDHRLNTLVVNKIIKETQMPIVEINLSDNTETEPVIANNDVKTEVIVIPIKDDKTVANNENRNDDKKVISSNENTKVVTDSKITVENKVIKENEVIAENYNEQDEIPAISYEEVSAYLNNLVSKSVSDEKRYAALKNYTKYFKENTKVRIYVNSTRTDLQPIESFIERMYSNNKNIAIVNFIENKSKYNKDEKKYEEISVQEIWLDKE